MAVSSFGGVARHEDLAGLLSDDHPQYSMWAQGLLAERPPAGRSGRQYHASDEGMTYYDLGTSWVEAITLPPLPYLPLAGGTMAGHVVQPAPNKFFWSATAADEATPTTSGWLGATGSETVPHYGMGTFTGTSEDGTTNVGLRSISNYWGLSFATNGVDHMSLSRQGTLRLRRGSASGGGTTTPGVDYRTALEFYPTSVQPGEQVGIGWHGNASTANTSVTPANQAGILVESSGSYGTRMNFYTTNTYATGMQRAMQIDQNGNVYAHRAHYYELNRNNTMARVAGNWGQHTTHGTITDFNNSSLDFGATFIQGSTNGPGMGASQYYQMSLSLGSEYTHGQYVCQLAIPRHPQGGGRLGLGIRYKEGGSWQSWRVIGDGHVLLERRVLSGDLAGGYGNLFFNIPSGFRGVRIVSPWCRHTSSSSSAHIYFRLNQDSAGNYGCNYFWHSTGAMNNSSYETGATQSYAVAHYFYGNSYGGAWLDLNFTSGPRGRFFNRSWNAIGNGGSSNAYGYGSETVGGWHNGSAINRIDLWNSSSFNWESGSEFLVYGIP